MLDGTTASPDESTDALSLLEWPEWTSNLTIALDHDHLARLLPSLDDGDKVVEALNQLVGRYHCNGVALLAGAMTFKQVAGPEVDGSNRVTMCFFNGSEPRAKIR